MVIGGWASRKEMVNTESKMEGEGSCLIAETFIKVQPRNTN